MSAAPLYGAAAPCCGAVAARGTAYEASSAFASACRLRNIAADNLLEKCRETSAQMLTAGEEIVFLKQPSFLCCWRPFNCALKTHYSRFVCSSSTIDSPASRMLPSVCCSKAYTALCLNPPVVHLSYGSYRMKSSNICCACANVYSNNNSITSTGRLPGAGILCDTSYKHFQQRCMISTCTGLKYLRSSLPRDFHSIFRFSSTAAFTARLLPRVTVTAPVPVGHSNEVIISFPDLSNILLTNIRSSAERSTCTGVAAKGVSVAACLAAIALQCRHILGKEIVEGLVKPTGGGSVVQRLRKTLEQFSLHLWKGNRWKGPQKNKWKWYHRHGYWATRKKLIDFTKYRRYGYHERYGMGRPKIKFWEDPSRYKRLRQAVRFW